MSVQVDIVEYEINLDVIEEEIVANIVDGVTVLDDGTKVANVRVLDFQGSGVTVTQQGNKVIITITGGGSGGGGTWGSIIGTLSAQTDLQAALDLKASIVYADAGDASTLAAASALVDAVKLSLETSAQTGDFTFALTDAYKTVPISSGTTKTGTVPTNATVAFPIGTIIGVKWQTGAAGQPAIAAAGGVTINNTGGNLFVPAVSVTAYLIKTATNTWTFSNGAPLNTNLAAIANLVPVNDDIIQYKAGVWTNRTMAQLRTDLGATYVTICGATLNSGGNPADATLYYFGQDVATIIASVADGRRVYVPLAGTIVSARVSFVNGSNSTGESGTLSLRLNNTSDTTISAAVLNNATQTTFVNSALSIAVVQGDYFEFKWLTPTWATNPTGVSARWNVVIKVWG